MLGCCSARLQHAIIELAWLAPAKLREVARVGGIRDIREFQGARLTITAIEEGPTRDRLDLKIHPVVAVSRETLGAVARCL